MSMSKIYKWCPNGTFTHYYTAEHMKFVNVGSDNNVCVSGLFGLVNIEAHTDQLFETDDEVAKLAFKLIDEYEIRRREGL